MEDTGDLFDDCPKMTADGILAAIQGYQRSLELNSLAGQIGNFLRIDLLAWAACHEIGLRQYDASH